MPSSQNEVEISNWPAVFPISGTVTANQGGAWTVAINNYPALQDVQISNGVIDATLKSLSTQLVAADIGLVTNTIIHGLSTGGGGGYVDVKVTPSGALTVDANQASPWLVSIGDSPNLDAFSRLRVSNPVTLFESVQRYGDDLLKWETALVGTGSSTFSAQQCCMIMSTGGTLINASCTRMTRQHFPYQAGKSLLWFQTFSLGTHVEGVQYNVGCAITNGTATIQDAILFRRGSDANGTLYFIIVDSTTGTPLSDIWDQANWNLDTLDGSGNANNPSGILLDATAPQILVYDLQFLGVGRVRCGFDIGGQIIYAHEFNHANDPAYPSVYLRTATLAAYLNIRNATATLATASMQHICTAVITEGGDTLGRTYEFTHSTGITSVNVSTRRPILAIRAKATGPNSVRNTGLIIPPDIDVLVQTQSIYWEIVLNPTVLTAGGGAPTWTAINSTYSLAEGNTNADAITGGIVIKSGFAPAGTGTQRLVTGAQLSKDLALVYSARGNVQDTLVLVGTAITGTASVNPAFNWEESGV